MVPLGSFALYSNLDEEIEYKYAYYCCINQYFCAQGHIFQCSNTDRYHNDDKTYDYAR